MSGAKRLKPSPINPSFASNIITQHGSPPNESQVLATKFTEYPAYQAHLSQAQLRAEFQNKSVEMSIHVTTGFAAAAAAAWIAVHVNPTGLSAPTDFTALRMPIVLVSGFYALIQSLILSNYIYQTFHLHSINWVCVNCFYQPLPASGAIIVSDELKETNIGNWRRWFRRKLIRFCSNLLITFQPLILYFSMFVALLVISLDLVWPPQPILPLCWAIVIVAILLLWLLVLFGLHLACRALATEAAMRVALESNRRRTCHIAGQTPSP